MAGKKRVLVIGLDGATFNIIGPMLEKGRMKNIGKLMDEGSSGDLISSMPPITSTGWVSFMTGKNPGKHKIFDFVEGDPFAVYPKIVTSKTIKSKKLWNMLNENGKRTCVLNVPFTYPVEEVDGVMVSGVGAPALNENAVYPAELRKEISKIGYKSVLDNICYRDLNLQARGEKKLLETQLKSTMHMLKKEDWDFFMVVFNTTDTVAHYFWSCSDPNHPEYTKEKAEKYGTVIEDCYDLVDDIVGKLVDAVDEDTTIVIMSDHGHGGHYRNVLLNNWLKGMGMLRLKEGSESRKGVKPLLAKMGINKEKIQILFERLRMERYVKKVPRYFRDRIPNPKLGVKDVDLENTKAYCKQFWGKIFINLEGRNEPGVVKKQDYENVRQKLIEEAYNLRDPETNELLVEKVYKPREELYKGPYINSIECPDLLLVMKNKNYLPFESFEDGSLFGSPPRPGTHRMQGVTIWKGKNIRKDYKIKDANIMDITPTILHLFGIPVPSDMDGKVLEEILEETARIEYKKVDRTEEEKERIKEKIKDLKL